jgi:hypothetical protein
MMGRSKLPGLGFCQPAKLWCVIYLHLELSCSLGMAYRLDLVLVGQTNFSAKSGAVLC